MNTVLFVEHSGGNFPTGKYVQLKQKNDQWENLYESMLMAC